MTHNPLPITCLKCDYYHIIIQLLPVFRIQNLYLGTGLFTKHPFIVIFSLQKKIIHVLLSHAAVSVGRKIRIGRYAQRRVEGRLR